jgi:hypothetical protein
MKMFWEDLFQRLAGFLVGVYGAYMAYTNDDWNIGLIFGSTLVVAGIFVAIAE